MKIWKMKWDCSIFLYGLLCHKYVIMMFVMRNYTIQQLTVLISVTYKKKVNLFFRLETYRKKSENVHSVQMWISFHKLYYLQLISLYWNKHFSDWLLMRKMILVILLLDILLFFPQLTSHKIVILNNKVYCCWIAVKLQAALGQYVNGINST